MVNITTPEDIIQALLSDPELLRLARQAIMTEDVMALPAQFTAMLAEIAELRTTQNSILETQASMLKTQESMLAEIADLRRTQNSILESQDKMQTDIQALHRMYRRQHDDLDRFRGNYAEDAAIKRVPYITEVFNRQLGVRHTMVRRLRQEDLAEILEENYEAFVALDIGEGAWRSFMSPDFIGEVRQFGNPKPAYYIAVEASYTANPEDLLRAANNARILRASTGLDAYSVVAGVRIAPSVEDILFDDPASLLQTNDPNAALWYQIEEEALEPLLDYPE